MTMTNEEIRRDWEGAKDKKKQIGILADLNTCSRKEIIEILKEQGVDARRLPRNRQTTVCAVEPTPERAEATPATVPAQEKSKPYVKPRLLHDTDRLCDLFNAITSAILEGVTPDPEWTIEFNDLWIAYINKTFDLKG